MVLMAKEDSSSTSLTEVLERQFCEPVLWSGVSVSRVQPSPSAPKFVASDLYPGPPPDRESPSAPLEPSMFPSESDDPIGSEGEDFRIDLVTDPLSSAKPQPLAE
jgi:hypothetical protein